MNRNELYEVPIIKFVEIKKINGGYRYMIDDKFIKVITGIIKDEYIYDIYTQEKYFLLKKKNDKLDPEQEIELGVEYANHITKISRQLTQIEELQIRSTLSSIRKEKVKKLCFRKSN